MTLTSHWGSRLFLCWNNCCSVTINIELYCSSGLFLSLQSKRIKTSWLQRWLLSECLKITNYVVSVSAGSRVSKELRYTKEKQGEESVFTSQMLIQTPKQEGTNILTQEALLLHLEAALSASKVQVSLYGKWVQPPEGLQGISNTYKHEGQSFNMWLYDFFPQILGS